MRTATIVGNSAPLSLLIRKLLVRLHRYAGLTTAGFLAIAGLTGSVIAFHHELDAWLNPELFKASGKGAMLSPGALVAHVEQQFTNVRVVFVRLPSEPGVSAEVFVVGRPDPATGKALPWRNNHVLVDPVTGDVLGTRSRSDPGLNRAEIIPFLYRFHYSLTLGLWGKWLFGIVALVWLFDCFVGFYLTLPHAKPFLTRWRPSWFVKTSAGAYRLNFDLHRAAGLWFWIVLAVVAFSSVYFNLNREVFMPVLKAVASVTPTPTRNRSPLPQPLYAPPLSWEDAVARAEAEMRRRGIPHRLEWVGYDPAKGFYSVAYKTPEDIMSIHAGTRVYVDAAKGDVIHVSIPGRGTLGDAVIEWQFPLHSGKAFGLAGRIIICITGIVVAMLSVTGVVIWWRKLSARRWMELRRRDTAKAEASHLRELAAAKVSQLTTISSDTSEA